MKEDVPEELAVWDTESLPIEEDTETETEPMPDEADAAAEDLRTQAELIEDAESGIMPLADTQSEGYTYTVSGKMRRLRNIREALPASLYRIAWMGIRLRRLETMRLKGMKHCFL